MGGGERGGCRRGGAGERGVRDGVDLLVNVLGLSVSIVLTSMSRGKGEGGKGEGTKNKPERTPGEMRWATMASLPLTPGLYLQRTKARCCALCAK